VNTVSELLCNEAFVKFYFDVRNKITPDEQWEDWAETPENQNLCAEAFAALDKLSLRWAEEQINEKFHSLNINQSRTVNFRILMPWLAALLCVVIGVSFFVFRNDINGNFAEKSVIKSDDGLIEKINRSENPMLVLLEDGSSLLLNSGGKVSYPSKFDDDKREVYLEGEAFFEVSKDPQRPFFVYANDMVAKVLGTSFTMRSLPGGKDIELIVKTGKVAVFKRVAEETASYELPPITVRPHEKLVFNADLEDLVALPAQAERHLSTVPAFNFEFSDVPASEIFKYISEIYGVNIIYNESTLKNCPVTASLADEPLYGKIELVCLAIEAEYKMAGSKIVIKSKGCEN
jgi:transmembrane sensor